jgi:hypothetical protein
MELVQKVDALVSELMKEVDTYSLTVKLPLGEYAVVAWAGKGDDISDIIEQETHFSYQYANTQNAKEASLSLLHNEMMEVVELPTPFFHAMNGKITVSNTVNPKNKQNLNFHWGTNSVKINVELIQIESLKNKTTELTAINAYITAENGNYKFNGKAFGTDQIKYIPKSALVNTYKENRFRVMTLYKNDNSMIVIERKSTKKTTEILYQKSLSKIILENPELSFETHNDFDITVKLPLLENDVIDTDITITINGWEIINSNEGIS